MGGAATLPAADESEPETPAAEDTSPIVATINSKPIRADEVQQALAPTLAGRKVSPQALAQLQAEALALLIDRRLVEKKVSAGGKGVTDEEIDTAQARIATQLEGQKTTLEKLLAERNITLEAFRKQLVWQLLWERTMEKDLTDEVLEDYFDDHKKDFDGSEVRASHILLRAAKSMDPAAIAELVKIATVLRGQIESGKYSFEEAAAMFSSGPSKEKGGDVGFFPRHGLMVEPFARAAFSLPIGEISQPIVSPFGVHLIKVTEIKPGKKTWTEVRDQLKPPAAQALFEKIAKSEREKSNIQFTGAGPHFKPDSRELVLPTRQ
jgi:parvulin-like peptidyl-prolyl isomerase